MVFLIHTELRCTVNHTSDLDESHSPKSEALPKYLSFASSFTDTVATYVGFALFTVSGATGEIKWLSVGKQAARL